LPGTQQHGRHDKSTDDEEYVDSKRGEMGEFFHSPIA
jgi:hypothetical protein